MMGWVVVVTMVVVVLLVELGEEVTVRVWVLVVVIWPVETEDELRGRLPMVVKTIGGGETVERTGYDVRLGTTGQSVTSAPQLVTSTVDVWNTVDGGWGSTATTETSGLAATMEIGEVEALAGRMGPVRSAVDRMVEVGIVDVVMALGRISRITLAQS